MACGAAALTLSVTLAATFAESALPQEPQLEQPPSPQEVSLFDFCRSQPAGALRPNAPR